MITASCWEKKAAMCKLACNFATQKLEIKLEIENTDRVEDLLWAQASCRLEENPSWLTFRDVSRYGHSPNIQSLWVKTKASR